MCRGVWGNISFVLPDPFFDGSGISVFIGLSLNYYGHKFSDKGEKVKVGLNM